MCPKVGAELGGTFSHVLAAEDVATYGALCALAEMDRNEIRRCVVRRRRRSTAS